MIVLGIDAAASSGHALVRVPRGGGAPELLTYGVVKAAQHMDVAGVVLVAKETGAELAYLESPFVDKNPDTTIKLALVVGRFAQECDRAGLPWRLCKASEWQRQLLLGLITTTSKRAQRKAAAQRWVKLAYGVIATEDEADAICMATWGAKTAAMLARVAAVTPPKACPIGRRGGGPRFRRRVPRP